MSIINSVGIGGKNNRIDVKVVQASLNLCTLYKESETPLVIDGLSGRATTEGIKAFQRAAVGLQNSTGRIEPRTETHTALKLSLPKGISKEALRAVMGHAPSTIVDIYHPLILTFKDRYQIDTPLRLAHFLAQIGHESLSFTYSEEIASGAAYEGRIDLGNIEPGDGVRFKGRGLIQLTGRSNYEAYGKHMGIDLLKRGNELLVSKVARYAVGTAFWFWETRNLNRYADADDIQAVTRRVNGGLNGLEDRMRYLERAKFFLV